MNYECIKTYVKGQVWDEELQANVYKDSTDDPKQPTGFHEAGDELDRLARQRMTLFPGETYREAFRQVLESNPDLKAAYGGHMK